MHKFNNTFIYNKYFIVSTLNAEGNSNNFSEYYFYSPTFNHNRIDLVAYFNEIIYA